MYRNFREGLLKMQISGPYLYFIHWEGLGSDLRICILNKFGSLDHTLKTTGEALAGFVKWIQWAVSHCGLTFPSTLPLRNLELLQSHFTAQPVAWHVHRCPPYDENKFGKKVMLARETSVLTPTPWSGIRFPHSRFGKVHAFLNVRLWKYILTHKHSLKHQRSWQLSP